MEPAGVSGTVIISDQRSYTKIETLHSKHLTEIHGALREVCTEFSVDRSTVSRWANRFRDGCVTIYSTMTQDVEDREYQQMKEV